MKKNCLFCLYIYIYTKITLEDGMNVGHIVLENELIWSLIKKKGLFIKGRSTNYGNTKKYL